MSDIGMNNPLKPDVPGPSQAELDLQKKQEAALQKETLDRERSEAKQRKQKRSIAAGRVGLRSLLSGGFGGFKLGG